MTAEVTAASPPAGGTATTQPLQPNSIKANEPGTEYVVLQVIDASTSKRIGTCTARDANTALKAVLESEEITEGKFVAIPARSWKPQTLTVTVETVTTLKLEEAK